MIFIIGGREQGKDSVCDEIVGKTYFGTEENKRLIHRSESIGKSRSV